MGFIKMSDFELTEEQKEWFGNRMDESATGAVKVPTYLYEKYRKLADEPFMSNFQIKGILIAKCYQ